MIVVYKIILIVLKVLLFSVETLGVFFLIHNIPKWRKRRKGAYGAYETFVNDSLKERLDEMIKSRKPVFESGGGLVGKSVRVEGKDYLVMGEVLEKIITRHPENSTSTLLLYRDGHLRSYSLGPEKSKELYTKYSKTGPVRSREIRKDVKMFCNNSCIQDCTECILKKYGKNNKA